MSLPDPAPPADPARPADPATPLNSAVAARLEAILERSRSEPSRIGYFAALYMLVERAIRQGLEAGEFDDAERLERVNEIFFARYVDALERHERGEPVTQAWRHAFEAVPNDELIVLQHLMLGANAHINLDLAVAVAETVEPHELEGFRADYDRMNAVLSSILDEVIADLSKVWFFLRWITRVARGLEDAIIGFSLRLAREGAWQEAVRLAALAPEDRAAAIAARDAEISFLAGVIHQPGFPASLAIWFVRRTERGTIPEIIDDLLD